MQDDNAAFIDNTFNYLLAYSFALFKQVEDKKYQDEDHGIQPLVYLSTVLTGLSEKSIPTAILYSNEYANLFSPP
ncbi:25205_t:CDS:2, partial [Cetraspora pellucida]